MPGISVKNLVVTRGLFPAIARCEFKLPEGSFTLVTGENGSGKTTLLKAISGMTPVERGEISLEFSQQKATSKDSRKLRTISAYLGHTTLHVRHIQVGEHLKLTDLLDQKNSDERREYQLSIEEAVNFFDLKDKLNVKVENLSAGQQRRLHLASTLIRSAPLLCVDEPHASLDERSKDNFDEIIKKQFDLGRNIIVATHDPQRLRDLSTHEIEMVNGTCKIAQEYK